MQTLTISLGAGIVFLPCAIGLSIQTPTRACTQIRQKIHSPRKNFQLALFKNPFSNASQEREGDDLKEDGGKSVLDSLGLESNTDPKTFAVDPERALDIATATLPVRIFSFKHFLPKIFTYGTFISYYFMAFE